jgi:hypothetical protein
VDLRRLDYEVNSLIVGRDVKEMSTSSLDFSVYLPKEFCLPLPGAFDAATLRFRQGCYHFTFTEADF